MAHKHNRSTASGQPQPAPPTCCKMQNNHRPNKCETLQGHTSITDARRQHHTGHTLCARGVHRTTPPPVTTKSTAWSWSSMGATSTIWHWKANTTDTAHTHTRTHARSQGKFLVHAVLGNAGECRGMWECGACNTHWIGYPCSAAPPLHRLCRQEHTGRGRRSPTQQWQFLAMHLCRVPQLAQRFVIVPWTRTHRCGRG